MHSKDMQFLALFSILLLCSSISIINKVVADEPKPEIDYKNFKYADSEAYKQAGLDPKKLSADDIATNYLIAKKAGILNKLSIEQVQAIIENSKGASTYDLNDFPEHAVAIVQSQSGSTITNLEIPSGTDRFFIKGNQLNYGTVKTPIPKGFSGSIKLSDDKKSFKLIPNQKVQGMPKLEAGETAEIEATDTNSVTLDDGTVISTKMSMSVIGDKQVLEFSDGKLTITKNDEHQYSINDNGRIYETNAKITIKGQTPSIFLSRKSKLLTFYVQNTDQTNKVRAELKTDGTFELGGSGPNSIMFDEKLSEVRVSAKDKKVTLNVEYDGGRKKVSNIVLGNVKTPASVKIGFEESDDKKTITSRLTRLSGEIEVSGVKINEKGVFTPASPRNKKLIDGLPDEMVNIDKPDEVWKLGDKGNNIYSTEDGKTSALVLENIGRGNLDDLAKKSPGEAGAAVRNNNPLNIKGSDKISQEIRDQYGITGFDKRGFIQFSDPAGGLAYGIYYLKRMFNGDNENYDRSMTLREAFDIYVGGNGAEHVNKISRLNIPGINKNTKIGEISDENIAKLLPAISSIESGVMYRYLNENGAFTKTKLNAMAAYASQSGSISITATNGKSLSSSSSSRVTSLSTDKSKDAIAYIKKNQALYNSFAAEANELYNTNYPNYETFKNMPAAEQIKIVNGIKNIQENYLLIKGNSANGKPGPDTNTRVSFVAAKNELYNYASNNGIPTDGTLGDTVKLVQDSVKVTQTGVLDTSTLNAMVKGNDVSLSKIDALIKNKNLNLGDSQLAAITSPSIVTDARKSSSSSNSNSDKSSAGKVPLTASQQEKLDAIRAQAQVELKRGKDLGTGARAYYNKNYCEPTDPYCASFTSTIVDRAIEGNKIGDASVLELYKQVKKPDSGWQYTSGSDNIPAGAIVFMRNFHHVAVSDGGTKMVNGNGKGGLVSRTSVSSGYIKGYAIPK